MFWGVVNSALAAQFPALLPGVPHWRPVEPFLPKWRLQWVLPLGLEGPRSPEEFVAQTVEAALARVVHHLRWGQVLPALALSAHSAVTLGWDDWRAARLTGLTALDGGAGAGAQLPAELADRLACRDQLALMSVMVQELDPSKPSEGGDRREGGRHGLKAAAAPGRLPLRNPHPAPDSRHAVAASPPPPAQPPRWRST